MGRSTCHGEEKMDFLEWCRKLEKRKAEIIRRERGKSELLGVINRIIIP